MKTLVFNATDTLFFRESRPMEAQGELQSVFPPPARTLAGAVRSLIGEVHNVDWAAYKANTNHPLRSIIGYGEQLPPTLRFQGAWLMYQGERLYPTPLHLMQKKDEKSQETRFVELKLDKTTVRCDLGENVRLAKLEESDRGAKSSESTWLSYKAMQDTLEGSTPEFTALKTEKDLFSRESRLGIGLNNQTRTVREGVLYQTKHIRPRKEVAIALDVQGLPEDFPNQVMLRLGAEGRSAAVQKMSESPKSLELPKNVGNTFALYLLTPLHRSDTPKDQPLPSFEKPKPENSKVTYWLGDIKGVAIKLHGAITGKMQREGGWDLANHRPKAVTNLIPAGSVFFCELVSQPATDAEREAILKQLHLKHHGAMTEYGYGQLAVGVWNDERI